MQKENFILKKFKVDGRKRITAKFEQLSYDGDVSTADVHEVFSSRVCHPDLMELLDGLKMTMAVANDLLPHRNLGKIPPKQREQVDALSKLWHKMDQEVIDGITVTGLAIQGDEESQSVVITGKRDVKGKNRERFTSVALNSPKIMLGGDIFGFEAELAEDVERIIDEVYLYYAERKSAQTEMAFND